MELNFMVDNEALAVVRNTVINANFDEVKTALTKMTEPYRNLVVTADMVGVAKTDRAKIRRVATSIDEYRKTVKRAYSEPLTVFEGKCKELTNICKEAADNLDEQIKNFEESAKKKKIDELEFYFQELPKKHGDYISFRDIYDERWKNATFSVEEAKEAIQLAVISNDTKVDLILGLHSQYEPSLLYKYRLTHDLSAVIQHKRELEEEADRLFAKAKAEQAEQPKKKITHELSANKLLIDLNEIDAQTKKKLTTYLTRNEIPYREIM